MGQLPPCTDAILTPTLTSNLQNERTAIMHRLVIFAFLGLSAWAPLGWVPCLADEPTKSSEAAISYSQKIEPILRAKCQGCHQPAKALGGYELTSLRGLLSAGDSGMPAVVPGKPNESELLRMITPIDGMAAMPKDSAALSDVEVSSIRQWIAEGAVQDTAPRGPTIDPKNPPTYSRPPVVAALAYSPDGKYLASSGFHETFLMDTSDFQTLQRLVGLSERVQSIAFSPDASRLAITGGSPGRFGEVQMWSVATGELELSHQVTFDTLFGGSFSPDGKLFAFAATDRVVRAIDPGTGIQKLHQGAHEDWSLATVFNPSGTHLLSAGRDMTVKLTEVATERFIDNVTSITPGALKGGVSALEMHPNLDQVLVGGADGVPKIYRIFRETARRIGDDANLVRAFPAMMGRIFDLSITADGRLFAVASTLDGKSQVRVFPFDFQGQVPDNVKAAQSKPLDQRSDEEKNLINQFFSQSSAALTELEIADSVYAIAIHPAGGSLVVGGANGVLRQFSIPEGKVLREWIPVPLEQPASEGASDLEPQATADSGLPTFGSGLSLADAVLPELDQERQLLPNHELLRIEVQPRGLELVGDLDYLQLVVSAFYSDGSVIDVTRMANYSMQDPVAEIDRLGLVRLSKSCSQLLAHGRTLTSNLKVTFGQLADEVSVSVGCAEVESPVDFVRDVNPILTRLGCNSGTCHGGQQGKNGFQLSLRGYDPLGDVRALSDDLTARRLNTAAPDASLMLMKPVASIPHAGGLLLTPESSYYRLLRDWIVQGAGLSSDSVKVQRIEIFPAAPILDREGAWQQFRVTAHYPDGSKRDVTHETFIESSNSEVCESLPGGRVRALRRGEAAMLARYEGTYAAATVTVMGDRAGFQWQSPEIYNSIDLLTAQKWQRMKILPSGVSEDHVFLRRIRLDLTGLPPSVEELKSFLEDRRPSRIKRQEKIEQLLGSKDYVEHWTNKWADLLQVNSKYLGAEGAAAFRQWIRSAVQENRPYDQFVRSILTASGSNKDNPAASYYKILREPELLVENTTHLFLAVRFNCNKCHDHPFERWTQDQYYELAAFFAQTDLRADPAGGEQKVGGTAVEGAKPLYELVADKDSGDIKHARTGQVVEPSFPYESSHPVAQSNTRRERLAAWMTSSDNDYFATSLVNRLWGYMTGVGLIEPLDDIRAGNPPSNPELLQHLREELIRSGFDVQHILRLICNSRTYQLSVAKNRWNADDELNYSSAKARRLPAEVLYDSVYRVTGTQTAIPGVQPGMRAAELPDVAFNPPDGFLTNLGRPVRESACECERSDELQLGPVMALVSGPTIGTAIGDAGNELASLAQRDVSRSSMIEEIYLRVLSRYPTSQEVDAVLQLESEIQADHQSLEKALAEKEQWWRGKHAELEQQRLERLEQTRMEAANREQEIAPERQRLEQERLVAIDAARQALAAYEQNPVDIANQYLASAGPSNHWFPLAAASAESTNMAQLIPQADRSVSATGDASPATYTVRFASPLRNIRGLRLEFLPNENLPGGGPGLSAGGNFVITEVQVHASPRSQSASDAPQQKTPQKIATAKASFTQAGFDPAQTIDGSTRGQGGWAVAPRGGIVHWLSYAFAAPVDYEGGVELTVDIHQYHDAAEHRLGRFRISVTTDEGEVHLGYPEDFSASAAIAEKDRKPENLKALLAYLDKSDARWIELRATLAKAEAPVPPDAKLTALQNQIVELEKPTADDAGLVQLRSDYAASAQQLSNQRLTLAQDLTWALINSPAFLFNH